MTQREREKAIRDLREFSHGGGITGRVVQNALALIEDLTPKYDPSIPKHVEELRLLAGWLKDNKGFDASSKIVLEAASRIEAIQPDDSDRLEWFQNNLYALLSQLSGKPFSRKALKEAIEAVKRASDPDNGLDET